MDEEPLENALFEFAEFESFYKHFRPLTPYGRDFKKQKYVSCAPKELQAEYELLEHIIAFIRHDPAVIDKLEYHLKRIPRLNSLEKSRFDATDIFLTKKFLNNYEAIVAQLSSEICARLQIVFASQELLNMLNIDATQTETFYLSEKYSDELASERQAIKTLDEQIRTLRRKHLDAIRSKFALDFRFKDFLVIEEQKAVKLDQTYVFREPFDTSHLIVKPVFPEEYFLLHARKDQHLRKEQEYEQQILARISTKICQEQQHLLQYRACVRKLDVLIAKGRVSMQFRMTKPVLQAYHKLIKIQDGRFLPLLERCSHLQTTYYPLNVAFDNRGIVISGSNMGGKTALLQSIAFFQLLTQLGFFVPAARFETVVFDQMHYIGEQRHESVAGLSSFGLELFRFMNAYNDINGRTLYLIDEFARTTNSHEAAALISAILQLSGEHPDAYTFLSTHFMELPKLEHLSFYRMKGLNEEAYTTYFHRDVHYDLLDRIRLINRFMEYEVMPDTAHKKSRDALKIAQILGLDQKIIHYAQEYLTCKTVN